MEQPCDIFSVDPFTYCSFQLKGIYGWEFSLI